MMILLTSLALLPPPLIEQSTLIVDGADLSAPFQSITDAMNAASPGDSIVVRGLKIGAVPVPYSDFVLTWAFPDQEAEVFPLAMKEGVMLKPANSNPVLIYQAVPSSEPLIRVQTGTAGQTTTIRGMRLIGGAVGVESDLAGAAGGGARTLQIHNTRFIRNEIGVSAVLKVPAVLTLDMQNCAFEPTTLMFAGLPDGYRTPTRGIRLHALEETELQIPRIEANLASLTLQPGYPAIGQSDFLAAEDLDELGNNGKLSRFIEVYASGIKPEHRTSSTQRDPIAEVVLAVNGGTFDAAGSEWDACFYGAAWCQSAGNDEVDHTCGYVASFTGSTVKGFRQVGLYPTAGRNSRAELEMRGGSVVMDTGAGQARTPGTNGFSGLHGFAEQGYVAILGEDFSSSENLGHGLFLSARHTKQNCGEYPVGAYLGITDGRFHSNGGAGISLLNAYDEVGGVVPHGVTGGTWHVRGGNLTLIADGSDPTHLEHGQGVVDRCAISNNDEHGIILRNPDYATPSIPSAISLRVTNSAIWNNTLGGVVAVSDVQDDQHQTYMICPLILCTIAGNGSTMAVDPYTNQVADYNVEFFEFHFPSHHTEYIYEFTDTILQPPATIGTRFSNLILQRQAPGAGAQDFGPHLRSAEMVADQTASASVDDFKIGVAAIRADYAWVSGYPLSGSEQAPFLGPLNWTSTDPSMFALTGSGSSNFFSQTWQYLPSGFSEALHDFLPTTRDPLRSTPMPAAEKGAFERPNAP